MGLFDDVKIAPEIEITGFERREKEGWQTKTFSDPYLDKYEITAEGRLVFYPWKDGRRSEVGVDQDYHGIIELHDTVQLELEKFCAVSVLAKFTDGKLVDIHVAQREHLPHLKRG